MSYSGLSLWFDQVAAGGDALVPRPALANDRDADVVIVGAGFTGLWTAYYLQQLDSSLDIAIVEAETAGFGASGRNGGWASALFPRSTSSLEATHGTVAAIAQRQAMIDTVDEIGSVITAEGFDCDFVKGGTLEFARGPVQWQAAKQQAKQAEQYGVDKVELRNKDEFNYAISGLSGTLFEPNCARMQPAKLVRQLATVVEQRGATIYERSKVTSWQPHQVVAAGHTIRAGIVVLAVEGYRAGLDNSFSGQSRPKSFPPRTTLPLYSSMIATAPLTDKQWSQIGIEHGQTFADFRHLTIYGQRTADNRIAFGGRGAKYHWGSSIKPAFDKNAAISKHLISALHELIPSLPKSLEITHSWGGPLGVARDWHASVGFDNDSGLAWCGGYVGDGLSTTNLGGRTLSQLITGAQTPLTSLPWVDHRLKSWEPEPLRFLGTNAGLVAMDIADAEERLCKRPSLIAKLMGPLIGG